MTVRLAQVFHAENIGSVLDGANSPGALTDINGRFVFGGVDAAVTRHRRRECRDK